VAARRRAAASQRQPAGFKAGTRVRCQSSGMSACAAMRVVPHRQQAAAGRQEARCHADGPRRSPVRPHFISCLLGQAMLRTLPDGAIATAAHIRHYPWSGHYQPPHLASLPPAKKRRRAVVPLLPVFTATTLTTPSCGVFDAMFLEQTLPRRVTVRGGSIVGVAVQVASTTAHHPQQQQLERPEPETPFNESPASQLPMLARAAAAVCSPYMCEDCNVKWPHFGLVTEGKRRWCARCARKSHPAAQSLQRQRRCEDCTRKCPSFGHPAENKKRWCGSCAKRHPGAQSLLRRKICEECGDKQASMGLPDENKVRWCAACSRHRGARRLQRSSARPKHAAPHPSR
jgi:hypothetical protein